MSSLAPSPGGMPLGGATVDGSLVTVDSFVNPPTRIPQIIRNLVASDQGYTAETVFSVPGVKVEGGAVISTQTFPADLFLDPNQSIRPRAPGGEAPLLGSKDYVPQVNRPESMSGRIEVHDEARRWNQVFVVQNQFLRAANTFSFWMQQRAIETLQAAVTAWGRTGSGGNWRGPFTTGLVNVDPATLPGADFDAVLTQFIADKTGVRPDTLILHQNDASALRQAYSGPFSMKLSELLADYGITNLIVSPMQTEGKALFVKAKQVGAILFDLPLGQEYERHGTRKTDVFILEMAPVFVAYDASCVFELTGINS